MTLQALPGAQASPAHGPAARETQPLLAARPHAAAAARPDARLPLFAAPRGGDASDAPADEERQGSGDRPRGIARLKRWLSDVSLPAAATSNEAALALCVLVGAVLWAIPPTESLSASGIHLLAVFLSVVLALSITAYPIALVVGLALVILTLTQTFECQTRDGLRVECSLCGTPRLSADNLAPVAPVFECRGLEDGFKVALSGFANPVAWLITCAFHLGKAVDTTHLGRRIALALVSRWGVSVAGLGLSVFASEMILAPFVPSNTARGGGIVLPIVSSMISILGSTPSQAPALGRFLVLCGSHANLLISSMFVTGAAPNPVVAETVRRVFPDVGFGFFTWTLGASVPALCSAALLLAIFHALDRPAYDAHHVLAQSRLQLEAMGPMSLREKQLCGVLAGALGLWMTGARTGIPEALVGMMALVACLFLGVISWDDVARNAKAWDTYFWLAGMLVMAEQLTALGVSKWIGVSCAALIDNAGLSPLAGSMLLAVAYFLSSMLFSSITGHAVALVGPFLEAGKAIGAPALLITPLLAYFSSLCACLTHFSTGSVVLYFAQGFVPQRQWLWIGLWVAATYFGVYFSVGVAWWKMLGFF